MGSSKELLEDILRVNGALRQTIASLVRDVDLTEPLADALWQLAAGRALSRREVAERLQCDPSNVTFLVDRLQRAAAGMAIPAGDRSIRPAAVLRTDPARSPPALSARAEGRVHHRT
jgi:hypothetical protein